MINKYDFLAKSSLLILLAPFIIFSLTNINAVDEVIDNTTNEGIKGSINNGNDSITLKEVVYSRSNNTEITINSGKNITILN